MQSFVCGKYIDRYLIANRFNSTGAIISEERYYELLELSKTDSEIAPWIIELFAKLGVSANSKQKLKDAILVKKPTEYNFGRASYEITESCNYKCGHCYLGCKIKNNLSLSDKKKIIELIERSGCLWLQITGGEPLLDRDFIEVYLLAHSLGLLITLSTNGSLLTKHRIAKILKAYPPYRLTISVYGSTANSYESLTQSRGSFQQFMNGVSWANKTAVRTRLNIIATKYNQNEITSMADLAKNFGFEYYIFSVLSPTIYGDPAPIGLMPQDCKSIKEYDKNISKENHYAPCNAGKTSFHINSMGKASVCKTVRKPNISLLQDGVSSFRKLSQISKELSGLPSPCDYCELRESCLTCPSVLKLYLNSATVPSSVCRKYCSNDLKR